MKKLAIITTHPIQYNAPWFRLLSEEGKMKTKVFYTWSQSERGSKYDPGFGKNIEWDIPLLEGYDYEFVENNANDPGTHHFKGIINPSLIRVIENWAPNRILVIGWSFESHLKCIRHFHGKIPVYFRGDSTLLDEKGGFSIKKLTRRWFLKWVYHYVDMAFYVGTSNKQYFMAHGLTETNLAYTPHAIDNKRFGQKDSGFEEKAFKWRQQLGITEEECVVLFAGKLEPKKNPDILMEVARQIPHKNLKFLFVGNGILEKELKEATREEDCILFLDFQNQLQMPIIYHMCDIFVLPSIGPGETWGLAVNEAMACGKPVIVSDRCGCAADLVDDGRNGYIFPAGDIFALREKIIRLLAPAERARMGKASREKIQDYSFVNIIKEIQKH